MAYAKSGVRQHRLRVGEWPERKGGYAIRHLPLLKDDVGRTEITIAGHPEETRLVATFGNVGSIDGPVFGTQVFEGVPLTKAEVVDEAVYKTEEQAKTGHGRMVKKWTSKD